MPREIREDQVIRKNEVICNVTVGNDQPITPTASNGPLGRYLSRSRMKPLPKGGPLPFHPPHAGGPRGESALYGILSAPRFGMR
jgi:hypothetical protein